MAISSFMLAERQIIGRSHKVDSRHADKQMIVEKNVQAAVFQGVNGGDGC